MDTREAAENASQVLSSARGGPGTSQYVPTQSTTDLLNEIYNYKPETPRDVQRSQDDKRKRQKILPTQLETEAHIPTEEEIAAAEQVAAYVKSCREA